MALDRRQGVCVIPSRQGEDRFEQSERGVRPVLWPVSRWEPRDQELPVACVVHDRVTYTLV